MAHDPHHQCHCHCRHVYVVVEQREEPPLGLDFWLFTFFVFAIIMSQLEQGCGA